MTGTKRQIDVLIRQQVGQYELVIVMDCKDWKRPIDVNGVGQFIELVKDVRANKGVMVAATGFSGPAKTRAQKAGIDLYRVVDPGDHDWKAYVTIPAVADLRKPETFQLRVSGSSRFRLYPQDFRGMVVYDKEGESLGTVLELLDERWAASDIPYEPGTHEAIRLTEHDAHLLSDGELHKVELAATITVSQELYFKQLEVTEIAGFQDEIQGGIVAREFVTAGIHIPTIEEDWERIQSVDDLAVRPLMRLQLMGMRSRERQITSGEDSDGV